MLAALAMLAVAGLAFANGANDNFKAVATLYGSGVTSYRRALAWTTVTTMVGSVLAVWFGGALLMRFSGKGIVPETLVSEGTFGATVALAAAMAVWLATRLGMPVSTTHALLGAMVGAAIVLGQPIYWSALGSLLIAPLLLSPLAAALGGALLYASVRPLRQIGASGDDPACVCAGHEVEAESGATHDAVACATTPKLALRVGTRTSCRQALAWPVAELSGKAVLDAAHFCSAGLVALARALNDTPKIAALAVTAAAIDSLPAMLICTAMIAVGGLVGARRVADSMSHRITTMNAGQGFAANLVTSSLVTSASLWGMPVSTTHVSCGSIFGLGAATGQGRWRFFAVLLGAWLATGPLAACLGLAIGAGLQSPMVERIVRHSATATMTEPAEPSDPVAAS